MRSKKTVLVLVKGEAGPGHIRDTPERSAKNVTVYTVSIRVPKVHSTGQARACTVR